MSSVELLNFALLSSMCVLKDFKSLFFAVRIVFVMSSDVVSCVDPSPESASVSSVVLNASVPT